MNDIVFCKNFKFVEYRFGETVHRDNSHGANLHYIGFMKHGKGRILYHNQVLEIYENEMFYIPKGCEYHSYWIAEDYVQFDSIGFLYFPTSTANGYRLQKINYTDEVFNAFSPLSIDKSVNTSSIGALYSLLGLLQSQLTLAPTRSDTAVYEKLLLFMRTDPQMTIPQYAALCEVSESLLYNYTKKVSGKTPNCLRQEILCQKAAELLLSTNYSVEEICDRLAFSSTAYFRKIFKSVYNKSPSQIRREEKTI